MCSMKDRLDSRQHTASRKDRKTVLCDDSAEIGSVHDNREQTPAERYIGLA